MLGPFRGFAVTLRQMVRPRVTTQYPKEKREKPQRFHGRHRLNRYPDGMEKCIGCELCAGVCPARCIYVRGADNPPDDPVSPGERYGFIYEINMLRCIFCAMCVEACPTEAITMTHLFEMSTTSRDHAIYTKNELLVEPDGTPNHSQEASRLIDLNELKLGDGWMRATAPGGRAAFEGVVGWTPSATGGDLPPETGQSATVVNPPSGAKVPPVVVDDVVSPPSGGKVPPVVVDDVVSPPSGGKVPPPQAGVGGSA
ncbi:MAG: NADH-quinone oxidoreductase subunit NuoI [bacterium]|nr:NADH-quinone oxidoreductase subunit NuoI [bacterium]